MKKRNMAAPIEEHIQENEDNFKKKFKFYKRKQPPPDLLDVVDFDKIALDESKKFSKVSNLPCAVEVLFFTYYRSLQFIFG